MANQTGRHFLQIPGPTPVPERILNAMSRQMLDHRGPTFGEFGLKLLADVKTIFKTTNPVIIYPVVRDGRVGGRLRQHAVAGRQGSHRRDGPVRRPVAQHGRAPRPQARGDPDRLARRRRRQCRRGAPQEGQGARHQGRVRGAQRDLDGCAHVDRRDPQGHGWRQASGPADGRCRVLAGGHGFPPRRVGRRRRRFGLAEGLDAAAGSVVHGHQPEGARCVQEGDAAALLLELGGHDRHQRVRHVPLHAGHRAALWARRGDRHAARGRPRQRVCAP